MVVNVIVGLAGVIIVAIVARMLWMSHKDKTKIDIPGLDIPGMSSDNKE